MRPVVVALALAAIFALAAIRSLVQSGALWPALVLLLALAAWGLMR